MNSSILPTLKFLVAAACCLVGVTARAGIEDLGKVDAVASKPDAPYVILLMTSKLQWNDRTIGLVEQKTANYMEFVKSGQLVQGRPAAAAKKVRMILVHEVPPTEDFRAKLVELQRKVEAEGMQFVWGGDNELVSLTRAP